MGMARFEVVRLRVDLCLVVAREVSMAVVSLCVTLIISGRGFGDSFGYVGGLDEVVWWMSGNVE